MEDPYHHHYISDGYPQGKFIDEKGFLYNQLKDNFKRTYEYLLSEMLEGVLPFMPMFIRYYTDHGANHSKEVVHIMDQLVKNIHPPLNQTEAFILLASAWLHDIGLLNNLDPKSGSFLSDEEIRDRHGELSADLIKKFSDRFFGEQSSIKHINIIRNNVIAVCRNHTENVREWYGIHDYKEYSIRTRLLISILRLADILDLRGNRAPRLTGEIVQMPATSTIHWEIYKVILDYKIYNLSDRVSNEKKIMIEINAYFSDRNRDLEKNLVNYKISQIEDELGKVRKFFKENGVNLLRSVEGYYRSDDNPDIRKRLQRGARNSAVHFKKAKNSFIYREYKKLEKDENPYILFDYCLSAAETIEDEETQKYWREKAQTYAEKIKEHMPPTAFFLSRIKYNELYLGKIEDKNFEYIDEIERSISENKKLEHVNPADKFLYGMYPFRMQQEIKKSTAVEKINILKGLNYLGQNINRYIDEYNFGTKKIQLRYGFSSIHNEVQKTIVNIIKHQITAVSGENGVKAVHDECCLCTGRVLSILSYWSGMRMPEKYYSRQEIHAYLKDILNWIKIQEKNKYSKMNGKNSHYTPRATASILEGLLDLYHFNRIDKKIIEEKEIIELIKKVKDALIDRINYSFKDNHKRDLTVSFSLIVSECLRALFNYQDVFRTSDGNIVEKLDLGGWESNIRNLPDSPLAEQIFGWESAVYWAKWNELENKQKDTKGNNSIKVSEKILNTIIEKNYEWRNNGSWNNDIRMTEKTVNAWLTHWEHFWRLEEEKQKKGKINAKPKKN